MPPVYPPAHMDNMYSPNARVFAQPNQPEPRIFKVRKGSVETNLSVDSSLRETVEQLLTDYATKEVCVRVCVCGRAQAC